MKLRNLCPLLVALALASQVRAQTAADVLEGAAGDCPCGVNYFVSGRAEGLWWWTKKATAPPLVSTSPAGTSRADAGVLSRAGSSVLYGGAPIDYDMRNGGRFTLDVLGDTCIPRGLEVSGFFLEQGTTGFLGSSAGSPILARPFFDASGRVQDSQLVAFPNVLQGSVNVSAANRFFGTEASLRENILCGDRYRVDGLCGYRFLYLREQLDITENLTNIDPAGLTPIGTRIGVYDSFAAKNAFHGGNFGLVLVTQGGPLTFDLSAKLAVGASHHDVAIVGGTVTQTPSGARTVNRGGLLAQSTNVGASNGAKAAVVPEVAFNTSWALTERIRLQAGYTFLWWSQVARPGDQIDFTVNSTGIPPGTLSGPARPRFDLNTSDFWVTGFNAGMEFRY